MIAQDEGIQVEGAVLSWLARAARGGMRDAISLLDQLRTFCGDQVDADSAREVLGLAGLVAVRPFLEALQEDRPGDALEALNDALDRGTDLRVYLADTLTYLRALMLLRYGAVTPLRAELPGRRAGLARRAGQPPGRRGGCGSLWAASGRRWLASEIRPSCWCRSSLWCWAAMICRPMPRRRAAPVRASGPAGARPAPEIAFTPARTSPRAVQRR